MPLSRAQLSQDFHGFGLSRPFRRDLRSDFQSAGGVALVQANVGQILGTRASGQGVQGEVRWNTSIGSRLYLLQHSNNNPALEELARTYVIEALAQEPRVRVSAVRAIPEFFGTSTLALTIRYDVVAAPGGETLLQNVEQTVRAF